MSTSTLLFGLLCLLSLSFVYSTPIVTTSFGKIYGLLDNNNVGNYLGIPYAIAPLLNLRWKPPLPWNTTYNNGIYYAYGYNDFCLQLDYNTNGVIGSEDCLYLNIFVPTSINKTAYPNGIPVLIYLNGDYFNTGSSNAINGSSLASNGGIIVVTLNYRLGVMGFLASEQLRSSDNPSLGIYGILDQRMAMQWIKSNIGAFGGNANQISLGGHNSGATSVCIHMVNKNSWGLFQRAILQSSSCMGGSISLQQSESYTQRLLTIMNCNNIQCLYTRKAEDLVWNSGLNIFQPNTYSNQWSIYRNLINGNLNFQPVIDVLGYELIANPMALLLTDQSIMNYPTYNFSATMAGVVALEADLLINKLFNYSNSISDTDYVFYLNLIFGSVNSGNILYYYPTNNNNNLINLLNIYRDNNRLCPIEWTMVQATESQSTGNSLYMYYFNHTSTLCGVQPVNGAELMYLFPDSNQNPCPLTSDEKNFSIMLQQFIGTFVLLPNSNGGAIVPSSPLSGGFSWPFYDGYHIKNVLTLDIPLAKQLGIGQISPNNTCDLWQTINGF